MEHAIKIKKTRDADTDSSWGGLGGYNNHTTARAEYGVFIDGIQVASIVAAPVGYMESAEWTVYELEADGHRGRQLAPAFTKHGHAGRMLTAAKDFAVRHYTDKLIEKACAALGKKIQTAIYTARG